MKNIKKQIKIDKKDHVFFIFSPIFLYFSFGGLPQ